MICSHRHKPVILYYLAEQFLALAYFVNLLVVQIVLWVRGVRTLRCNADRMKQDYRTFFSKYKPVMVEERL